MVWTASARPVLTSELLLGVGNGNSGCSPAAWMTDANNFLVGLVANTNNVIRIIRFKAKNPPDMAVAHNISILTISANANAIPAEMMICETTNVAIVLLKKLDQKSLANLGCLVTAMSQPRHHWGQLLSKFDHALVVFRCQLHL